MKNVRAILGYAMLAVAVGLSLTGGVTMATTEHVAEIQPIDPSSLRMIIQVSIA